MKKFKKMVKKYINDENKKNILLEMEKINYFEGFLKKNNKNKLIEILKIMEIKYYKNYELIFNFSEKPDGYFIILKGNVEIFKPKKKNSKLINNIRNNFQYFVNKAVYFDKLNILNQGDSFGNLALLNETKRSASVYAFNNHTDKCIILGYIKKNLFKSILANLEYKILNYKLEILKYFFKNKIKVSDYYEIVNRFELNSYKYNEKIISKLNIFEKIIFIYEGKCELLDNFQINNKNYKKKINNVVRILNKGDIIGINEYKKNLKNYEYNIISKSWTVKTIEITKNKFKYLLNSYNYINNLINNKFISFKNYKERKLKIINFWKSKNYYSMNQLNNSEKSNIIKNKLDKYNVEKNVFKLENFLKKNFKKIKNFNVNIDFNKYNKFINLDSNAESIKKKINENEKKKLNFNQYKINILKKKLKNYKIIRKKNNELIYSIKTSIK